MLTVLILAANLACSGDDGTLPPPPTGTDDTGTQSTDTAPPTDTAPTDTAPVLPEICYDYGVADSTIASGEGKEAAEEAVLVADGVPVWIDGTAVDGSTLFSIDMNGSDDVAIFYTERAIDEISGWDLGAPIDPFCVDHDFPCEGMSVMRLQLSDESYVISMNRWPEPVWAVAMPAAEAGDWACQE